MLKGNCHCGLVVWILDVDPESATACNCTICRRYGALWAYGHIDHDIQVSGSTTAYRRDGDGDIDFHFCPKCGCLSHYVGTTTNDDGRRRTAVNLRMSEPGQVEALPINHFDGLETWNDLPRDDRSVGSLWF